ncbi:DUF4221 family protein [Algoriphagus sp.]|uniref:DUF4221 family protein n=1 Tax=Algoriphagus sp. TaxID=1872435 RepID=UPI00262E0C34|nr:DUF4221 family protein [Algoriphagus sp.]
MKNTIYLWFGMLLISCSESNEQSNSANILSDFSLRIDSLVIDSGAEIFVPDMVYPQTLSADGNRIFSFYETDFEVFEFSIKEMKLLKRHPFEQEGPNGIKGWVSYFQALPGDELMIYDQVAPAIFTLDGQKVKNYDLDFAELIDFQSEDHFMVPNNLHLTPEKSHFLSLPMEFGKPVEGLAVIDIENKSGKVHKLPALDLTNEYQVVFRQGNSASFFGDGIRLQWLNGQFMVYSSSTADSYTYNHENDSLNLITFSHQLVENKKTGDFPNEVDSRERQQEVVNQIRKQITFGKFFWDETRNMYFRFATKNYQVSPDGSQRTADCYLFAYDENLNLIGETRVPEIKNTPFEGYFLDGQLYFYWPMGDQGGFIRFTFDFGTE